MSGHDRRTLQFRVYMNPSVVDADQFVVCTAASVPGMAQGIRMTPSRTGNRAIWECTAQVNPSTLRRAAPAPPVGLGAGDSPGVAAALFEVSFAVQSADRGSLRESPKYPVQALLPMYYHNCVSAAAAEPSTFHAFVQDELRLLLEGHTPSSEFLPRFTALVQSRPLFPTDLETFVSALDALIPSLPRELGPERFLPIAAAIGYYHHKSRRAKGERGGAPGGTATGEATLSVSVCRWALRQCPRRAELDALCEAWERAARAAAQRGERGSNTRQFHWYAQGGMLFVAEVLYAEAKAFEWLPLVHFLDDDRLPAPLDASHFSGGQRGALVESYVLAIRRVSAGLRQILDAPPPAKDPQGHARRVEAYATSVLNILGAFCPSVAAMTQLIETAAQFGEMWLLVLQPALTSRLRSLDFGPEDAAVFEQMVERFPFMSSARCAIALLSNRRLPNRALPEQRLLTFIAQLTDSLTGEEEDMETLAHTTRRWLTRICGADGAEGRSLELNDQIRKMIRCWDQVLQLPCFAPVTKAGQTILLGFSEACFPRDASSLASRIPVLRVVLQLEGDGRQIAVEALSNAVTSGALKIVQQVHDDGTHRSELLDLLFESPSPLRCTLLERLANISVAVPGMRPKTVQAGVRWGDLDPVLTNETLWTRLLSPVWVQACESPARDSESRGRLVRQVMELLETSAERLNNGTIELLPLHSVLRSKQTYQRLVGQVLGEGKVASATILDSEKQLRCFDAELEQLQCYVKMFCAQVKAEVEDLGQIIDNVLQGYNKIPLDQSMSKCDGIAVRPHLPWLFSLRGSALFHGMWKAAAKSKVKEAGGAEDGVLTQEFVVGTVIPHVRQVWNELADSFESERAVAKAIGFCVDLEMPAVGRELLHLEATAPKTAPWLDRVLEAVDAFRIAVKLKAWAPSVLTCHGVLATDATAIFEPLENDPTVALLRRAMEATDAVWDRTLGTMRGLVAPFAGTLARCPGAMQDFLITLGQSGRVLEWLVEHRDTDQFTHVLDMARPNTEDAYLLGALASLQQVRTFLAAVLYAPRPYPDLAAFLGALAALEVDPTVHNSLVAVQTMFDPVIELLASTSRSPGAQACYDLLAVMRTGTFHVVCAPAERDQIMCKTTDGKSFDLDRMAELRRQLLMTEVPAELEGETHIQDLLNEFVETFQRLEACGRALSELLAIGHFAYGADDAPQTVFSVSSTAALEEVDGHLQALQMHIQDWQYAISSSRNRHYFLNFYTVRELRYLVKHLPGAADDAEWQLAWPLLRIPCPAAEESAVRSTCMRFRGELQQPLAAAERLPWALGALDSVGLLLGQANQGVAPAPRTIDHLPDLTAQQQTQGDLVMRKMQDSEEGAPVFVCTADGEARVIELVLSIYARRGYVPESEELLLCSGHTTVEEIDLLLHRFVSARDHGREDRLYCLGNVHLLPYVVQCGTVETLRRLKDKVGYKRASALAFVSGQANQMLTNALGQYQVTVSALPTATLAAAVRSIGDQYHERCMEAVSSEINGGGKTFYILRQAEALQKVHEGQPLLHHVEVRETTTVSQLVATLLSGSPAPGGPLVIHLDLAHILPSRIDALMFELLIVGTLRDPLRAAVYHRPVSSIFFVEVPNTPGERTALQLPFCLLLPRTFLRMRKARMSLERPVFRAPPSGGLPLVEFVENTDLVTLAKVLGAMQREVFKPKTPNFNLAWKAATAPPPSPAEAYELIEAACSSPESPPSFLLFDSYARFLGCLLSRLEGWRMMGPVAMAFPSLRGLRHSMYEVCIATGKAFALRQIPKSMEVDTSPLVPEPALSTLSFVAGALARQLSRARSRDSHVSRGSSSGEPDFARVPSIPGALQRTPSGPRGSEMDPGVSRVVSGPHVEPVAVPQARAVEAGGVGRVDAGAYVHRFQRLSWETQRPPVAVVKSNAQGTVNGIDVITLDKGFVGNFFPGSMQAVMKDNGIRLDKDWTLASHQDCLKLVLQVEGGGAVQRPLDDLPGPEEYVITIDNLIKLLSIQQRLKYCLPVVLMGETGCGKTALVRFLAKTLQFPLLTLDVHGGITNDDIRSKTREAIAKATDTQRNVMLFFDEINAANCMAMFKSLIIDRVMDNTRLPDSVQIISCCNPYRLRQNKEEEEVALVYQHGAEQGASGITDPMKKLVYRVHPLPESLVDVVHDFGALSNASERLYTVGILRKELGSAAAPGQEGEKAYNGFIDAFTALLCGSQQFVRDANGGEHSVVSMRDIARAAKVFKWFLKYYSELEGSEPPAKSSDDGAIALDMTTADCRPAMRRAVVLTLGYCYHSRLNRADRARYRARVCDIWAGLDHEALDTAWLAMGSAEGLMSLLEETQDRFVSQMQLDAGIALNEALRENLFMLLVSIMNQIPILIVGKPGCSKSLAMDVLKNNLKGAVSPNPFFKAMPAVEVFAYQCSPLSTPEAIQGAFASARGYQVGDDKTIICVLLDEVGLAEESPHLPLKVLHRELEHLGGLACVGISNWALDAAKMSRCVTLYRPPPRVEDLCATAMGMVRNPNLQAYLRSLAHAFFRVYHQQRRTDFWGMREFYSTVRVISAELEQRRRQGREAVLEPGILMKTVLRNFGGRPEEELRQVIELFFDAVGMGLAATPRLPVRELISQNLEEPNARHLMLLTVNNAALRLLFESGIVDHRRAEVLFGGTYPNDVSDVSVAMNLHRIKGFMQQPISLVMVHCDSLYESLYDLLNQHYMEHAGQRYVRIAHGSASRQYPIHRLFRVVVVVEQHDAYYRLAPPLLNRFEKQVFLRKALMTPADEALLGRVRRFWGAVVDCIDSANPEAARRRAIAGFHAELLSSLVFTLERGGGAAAYSSPEARLEALDGEARRALTWTLTTEAVCIIASKLSSEEQEQRFGFDLVKEYFEGQQHSALPALLKALIDGAPGAAGADKSLWNDAAGAQVFGLTYSPIQSQLGPGLERDTGARVREVALHELSSSADIEKIVGDFYGGAGGGDAEPATAPQALVVHVDPAAAVLATAARRIIEHCRFVCEKARGRALARWSAAGAAPGGGVFVIVVVHLARGADATFPFDFDSQWRFVFLDSVRPPELESGGLPSVGHMLRSPLIDIVTALDFPAVMGECLRVVLSRMVYPHSRTPAEVQAQITLMLECLQDPAFVGIVRGWIVEVVRTVPHPDSPDVAGSFGSNPKWYGEIACAAHELAMAGTFRSVLHNKILQIVSALLTTVLAFLDRNGSLALLQQPGKRELWLKLSQHAVNQLSLGPQAMSAVTKSAAERQLVVTDAQTPARPFTGRFPVSWSVSAAVDGFRGVIEALPRHEQLQALTAQYRLDPLHELGMDPANLGADLLADYAHDFTAMHMPWMNGLARGAQQQLLVELFTRVRGQELTSILELHCLFWRLERELNHIARLMTVTPSVLPQALTLIRTCDIAALDLQLIIVVHSELLRELSAPSSTAQRPSSGRRQVYRDWTARQKVLEGLTEDIPMQPGQPLFQEFLTDVQPRVKAVALFLELVAGPVGLDAAQVEAFLADLPPGSMLNAAALHAGLRMAQRTVADHKRAEAACGQFLERFVLEVCLPNATVIGHVERYLVDLFCCLAAGVPVVLAPNTTAGVTAGKGDTLHCGALAVLEGGVTIPRSLSLTLSVLRKLLFVAAGDAKAQADRKISDWLAQISRHEGHPDSNFATLLVVLQEEEMRAELRQLSELPAFTEAHLTHLAPETPPRHMIMSVVRVRLYLQMRMQPP